MYQVSSPSKNYEKEILETLEYCSGQEASCEFVMQEEEKFSAVFLGKLRAENKKEVTVQIKIISDHYNKGLLAARKGQLKMAGLHFDRGEQYRKGLDDFQNLIVNVLTLPNISYLQYKKGNYEAAIADLFETIKTIDQLIDKGYDFLHCHKIQQVHNLIRINFRLENYSEAMELNANLLSHILDQSKPNWNFGEWSASLLEGIPISLLESMTFQVANEMMNNIIILNCKGEMSLQKGLGFAFKGLNHHASLESELISSQAIGYFIYLMDLFFNEEYDLFISKTKDFMVKAPSSYGIWKVLLLSCFQKINDNSYRKNHLSIRNTILSFINNKLNVDKSVVNQILN